MRTSMNPRGGQHGTDLRWFIAVLAATDPAAQAEVYLPEGLCKYCVNSQSQVVDQLLTFGVSDRVR